MGAQTGVLTNCLEWLDERFSVTKRKSTFGREIRGGVVTFLTMSYIVVLNPLILGFVKDTNGHYLGGGSEPNLAAIAAATALVAGLMSICMGWFAKYPLALATGLGLNAFVAFSIAAQSTWEAAMGLVVLEGFIILILVLSGLRQAVFKAVPRQLKTAISVGIGLFIMLIAFVDSGLVHRIPDAANTTVPVQLGSTGSLDGWPILVFVFGLFLAITLWVRKVKGAILISIVSASVLAIVLETVLHIGAGGAANPLGWSLNVPAIPHTFFDIPDFATIGHFDLLGAFTSLGLISATLLVISLLVSDFFDTVGTMTAIGAEADLLDKDGVPPHSEEILVVDSVAAIAGGMAGVSSNTSYIESATGVGEGARTGLASIVTGLLFLVAIFAAPLVAVIPSEAAVPALVMVGFLMMRQLVDIKWLKDDIAIPAALTIVLMPFTYSISAGIGAGFIAYVFIKAVKGKAKAVHPLLWGVSVLFVIYFAMAPIQALL